MVRHYVRRTNHNTYDVNTIISALKTLKATRKSIKEVAEDHNMKWSALSYHWRKHNKENIDIEQNVYRKRYTLRVFSIELEEKLLSYILMCAEVYSTVGSVWIRQLAYELAIENKVVLPPNWKKHKIAGKDWYLKFKDRHSKALNQHIPDAESLDQIMGSHRNRGLFFNRNYRKVLEKYKFLPKDVFILEQCKLQKSDGSMTVVEDRDCPKHWLTTGKSRVTFYGTVSAMGQSIPPFYIFSYKRYQKHQLLQQAPRGSKARTDPSGTMTKRIFVDYLKHIVEFVECNVEQPVLLLIDDQRYHISLEALKCAKKNGIVILTFPPRTTNKVQLLEQCTIPFLKTEVEIEDDIESERSKLPTCEKAKSQTIINVDSLH